MSKLIETMKNQPNFYAEEETTSAQIAQAEKSLGLHFASDFKEYLRAFGAASFNGHELTGFSADKNLDIVNVTRKNQQKCNVRKSLYVIEEAHIDGIVLWQDADGTVYKTDRNAKATKIANSLLEYITR